MARLRSPGLVPAFIFAAQPPATHLEARAGKRREPRQAKPADFLRMAIPARLAIAGAGQNASGQPNPRQLIHLPCTLAPGRFAPGKTHQADGQRHAALSGDPALAKLLERHADAGPVGSGDSQAVAENLPSLPVATPAGSPAAAESARESLRFHLPAGPWPADLARKRIADIAGQLQRKIRDCL